MFLLKKLILWFLGAFLIAGSAFFLTPVPEKAEETAASVSAQESAEQTPSDAATPENATKSEASKGPGEQASGKPEGVKKKKRRNTYGPGTWWYEEKPEEVPQGPAPTDKDLVWIASDTHYVSPKMTDRPSGNGSTGMTGRIWKTSIRSWTDGSRKFWRLVRAQ